MESKQFFDFICRLPSTEMEGPNEEEASEEVIKTGGYFLKKSCLLFQ
jgi:hypothetical protein